MSRITLRVGLSRSSRLPISSLGHRPLTYLNPPRFSSSVGERKIMNHFVVNLFFSPGSFPLRSGALAFRSSFATWASAPDFALDLS